MKAARIVAPLALLAAAAVVSGCQTKGATAVVPVVMAPYAAPAVTISPAPTAQAGGRAAGGGAVQATPVAATAMNPAASQYGPRPTTTPIAAYNIANMPVAATPVITVPTMMAPAPVAATPVAAAPASAAPAHMTAPATMATPVMMIAPAQPQAGGGQVMYMMMAPQPMAPQPMMAQPVVAAPASPPPAAPQPQPQLMTLPTYGAPVYVMPQAR